MTYVYSDIVGDKSFSAQEWEVDSPLPPCVIYVYVPITTLP